MDSARIQSAGSTAPMLADGEPQLFSLFPSPIPHEVELTKYITGIDARGYLHGQYHSPDRPEAADN